MGERGRQAIYSERGHAGFSQGACAPSKRVARSIEGIQGPCVANSEFVSSDVGADKTTNDAEGPDPAHTGLIDMT